MTPKKNPEFALDELEIRQTVGKTSVIVPPPPWAVRYSRADASPFVVTVIRFRRPVGTTVIGKTGHPERFRGSRFVSYYGNVISVFTSGGVHA